MKNDFRLEYISKSGLEHSIKRKIFISYRKKDNSVILIKKIIDLVLKQVDCAFWYDNNLVPGNNYKKEIQEAILESDVLLLLLTPTIWESDYVWNEEIKFALNNNKGIIPIVAGIKKEQLYLLEERIGQVHCLTWFFDERDRTLDFPDEFDRKLVSAIEMNLLNVDVVDRVNSFFSSKRSSLSQRYLSYEEIYIKGYGYLNSLIEEDGIDYGIELLKTIVLSYGNDEEFYELQNDAVKEIVRYAYIHNRVDLFFQFVTKYIKSWSDLFSPQRNIFAVALNKGWQKDVLRDHLDIFYEFRNALISKFKIEASENKQLFKSQPQTTINVKKAYFQNMNNLKSVVLSSSKVNELHFKGHAFYLMPKFREKPYTGVDYYLMRDNDCVFKYSPKSNRGLNATTIGSLYLSVDVISEKLSVLEVEFDTYGGIYSDLHEDVYSNIFNDTLNKERISYGYVLTPKFLPFTGKDFELIE